MSFSAGVGLPQVATVGPSARRDPVAWAIALLGVFVAAYALWWLSGLGRGGMADRFTGVLSLPGGLLLLVSAGRLRRDLQLDSQKRRAWTIMAVGLTTYGCGAVIHFAGSTFSEVAFLTPVVPVLEIATYPIAWISLTMLPRSARSTNDLVLFTLDLLVVAWSLGMLIWHFVMYPAGQPAPI